MYCKWREPQWLNWEDDDSREPYSFVQTDMWSKVEGLQQAKDGIHPKHLVSNGYWIWTNVQELWIYISFTRSISQFSWGNDENPLDLGFSGYPLRQNHTGGWFQLSSAIYRWWFGDDRFLNGESHNPIQSLVGGLEPWNFRTFHILGMSSSQLTNSIIFQSGRLKPPTRSHRTSDDPIHDSI